jgi:hypothetical protein
MKTEIRIQNSAFRSQKVTFFILVVCPGDSEECHSEERSDKESQGGRNNTRFFASTAFRLRMTTPQILVDEALDSGSWLLNFLDNSVLSTRPSLLSVDY